MSKTSKIRLPVLEEAKLILQEAQELNPGGWVKHSVHVAEAARIIAEHTDSLNPDTAYILGLLHDIGRRYGRFGMRHGLDGYNFAISKGYNLVAKICLSHIAFHYNDEVIIVGKWDGTDEELQFVKEYLEREEDTDYDRLIKLCDYLALPDGLVLLEKRLVDMAIRGGINEYTIPRWKSTFEIKQYFEDKMGNSIYKILPGVIDNTFDL